MPTLWTVTAAVTAWGVVALMIAASIGQLEHWRTSRMGRVGLSLLGKLVPLPVAVAAEAGLDGVTAAPIPMPEAEPTRPIAEGEGAIKVGLTLNPAGDVAVQIVERDPAYVPPAPPAPPAPAPELLSDHPYGGVLTIEAERAQNRAADLANFQLAPLAPRDIAADKIAAITVFAGLAATAHGLTLAPPHDPSAMAILTAQLADEFEVAGVKAVIDSAVEPLLIATKARGARNLRIAVNPAGHLTLEDVR